MITDVRSNIMTGKGGDHKRTELFQTNIGSGIFFEQSLVIFMANKMPAISHMETGNYNFSTFVTPNGLYRTFCWFACLLQVALMENLLADRLYIREFVLKLFVICVVVCDLACLRDRNGGKNVQYKSFVPSFARPSRLDSTRIRAGFMGHILLQNCTYT